MWFRKKRFDEFSEEIQSHIALETDRLIREGVRPEEARALAVRSFGNVLAVKERFYERRLFRVLDRTRQDVAYALRIYRKSPGFVLVAILSLALGIGANTAIFSLMDQIMFRSLPVVDQPHELAVLKSPGLRPGRSTEDEAGGPSWSYGMYKDLLNRNAVFKDMLARFRFRVNAALSGETESTFGELVSGNYFAVLGVRAVVGRVIDESDDVAPGRPVVVLNHGFWKRRFGSDPRVLNQSMLVNGRAMTIVGVTEPGFFGVQLGFVPDLFVPIAMKPEMTPNWNGLDRRDDYWLNLIGRLKPGVSRTQAEAALRPLYSALLEQEADQFSLKGDRREKFLQKTIVLEDGSGGRQTLRRDAGQPLLVLLLIVGLVLVVACVNLANLLMARAASRQREIVVRLAMGASRWRLVRQLVVESTLLSAFGGAAALLVAFWTLKALLQMIPSDADVNGLAAGLDYRVLLFNFALSVVTGLAFGLVPALHATRTRISSALKDGATGISAAAGHVRLRKVLVITQVAVTVLMLAAAGLFTRSLLKLMRADVGMQVGQLIQFDLSPDLNGYTVADKLAFYGRLHETISVLPGVQSATVAAFPVLRDSNANGNMTIEGYVSPDGSGPRMFQNSIGPGFFATMGIPLKSGREFTEADQLGSKKVCVINAAAAEHYFKGRDPIGYRIAVGAGTRVKPDMEIVGVVENSRHGTVDEVVKDFVYEPYLQSAKTGPIFLYVRTHINPDALMPSIRRAVQRVDPALPIVGLKTLQTQIEESVFLERMLTRLTVIFGSLAIVLATLGIYGVMSYVVARRTREIGIRMALGADRGDVGWLILREVMLMVTAGVVLGLPLALAFGHVVRGMLHGIAPHDPVVLAGAAIGVVLIGVLFGYVPARRATRINPLVAIRYE